MRHLLLFLLFTLPTFALGDTPPPGTVKAKTWSGDGNTAITATGSALDVNVTSFVTHATVDQGTAGTDPWYVSVRNNAPLPVNACQETGGNLAAIVAELSAPLAVTGTFWQATQPVSIASPVPVTVASPVIVQQGTPGPSASPWPVTLPNPLPSGTNSIGGVTQSGAWTVGVTSFPSPLPVSQSGAWTTGRTWSLTSGADSISAVQSGSWSVTANAGTNLNTSALALDTSVNGLLLSQGSTTSGESGPLVLGAVTTSAPSYSNGKSDPFSLTTAGALRIDGSATTQPVSGTFWQATQPVSGTFWQATQPVSGTFWQATQPVSIASLPALTAGSAIIGKVGIDQTTPGTTNGVQVNAALPAGANVIGHVIVDTAPTTAVTQSGTWTVNSKAATPTAVTVKQAAITVGTSAVRLTNDGGAPPSTRVLLVAQLLSSSTANCFLGSSGVTNSSTTRGVQMFAGQTFSFSNDAGDYYGICDASSQTVLITEQE